MIRDHQQMTFVAVKRFCLLLSKKLPTSILNVKMLNLPKIDIYFAHTGKL